MLVTLAVDCGPSVMLAGGLVAAVPLVFKGTGLLLTIVARRRSGPDNWGAPVQSNVAKAETFKTSQWDITDSRTRLPYATRVTLV